MRSIFIETLVDEAKNNENIFLITPDLGYSVLENFRDLFPNRFMNCGIQEANGIGISAGLALSGKIPYIYSIIPFVTMRPFEQIRVNLAYMNTNVRIVGVGAGFTYGQAGATHHAIEDIAIIRALPNMTILSPSCDDEVRELTKQSINHKGPIYLRLGRKFNINSNNDIVMGKPNILLRDKCAEIAIFFTGNALDIVLQTQDILQTQKINVELISIHTIKPSSKQDILELIENKKSIFSIEEHSIIGGLGSMLAEIIAESGGGKIFKRFGINDAYSHFVGNQSYIRENFKLNPKDISNDIVEILRGQK
ncbi:1-deoxy-D-xylulose-5-phosphate synthase [Helicobacter cinaedi]|uniref:transketolase family protein n=1 Tax=Helicobacter cinaedi TaxID=213 RepID=UPI001F2AE7B2|nr:transketolase C-terminal domain-containing protein [Helicobacter cinaedi]BDB67089.1 1-deoxy-D-xylulose-5-phosphate synthase [Helicobacter cinaedi]